MLDRDSDQAPSSSCVGTGRPNARRDLDHAAVARPGRSGHLIAAALSAAPFRPFGSHRQREAGCPRSGLRSSAGVSGPASSELTRPATRDAFGRRSNHCRLSPAGVTVVRETPPRGTFGAVALRDTRVGADGGHVRWSGRRFRDVGAGGRCGGGGTFAASRFENESEQGGISTAAARSAARLNVVDAILGAVGDDYTPAGGEDLRYEFTFSP